MTIPSSGTYTSTTVRDEWGYSFPFTSEQVRASAGLSYPWTSDQLRGKSARTVTLNINSSSTSNLGGTTRQSVVSFGISVSDGATPSSYTWYGAAYDTASTCTFYGEAYNSSGFTNLSSSVQYCDVVIAGTTYTVSRNFTYTTGDAV